MERVRGYTMIQSKALTLVNHIQIAAQKARSNLVEQWGDDKIAKDILNELYGYLFDSVDGPGYILHTTTKILERGTVKQEELYNLIYMVNETPPITILLAMWNIDVPNDKYPGNNNYRKPKQEYIDKEFLLWTVNNSKKN